MSINQKLFQQISEIEELPSSSKITIVGVGQVGMACAFSLLTQNVCSEICLVDVLEDKLKGEMLDLQHGSMFLRNAKIKASKDYSITVNSKICIVTAGVRQNPDESRLNLVQRNANLLKIIIPQLIKYSPDTILLIVSNPVDILTHISWKLSGLPVSRVIGSGTNLDSSRFRFLLSQKLGIAPSNCHGWIIGEHGDTSVAVWSSVNVAGVTLKNIDTTFDMHNISEDWNQLHKEVIDSAYKIINLKGYTSWAIGLSVASICYSILHNTNNVHAVSTLVEGVHGISEKVFLSLPCVINEGGLSKIIKQSLTDEELGKLNVSAKTMDKVLKDIKL